MVKEVLKGIWKFCSYLFWPQWGRNRKAEKGGVTLRRNNGYTELRRKQRGCGIKDLRIYGATEIKRRYDKW